MKIVMAIHLGTFFNLETFAQNELTIAPNYH